MLSKSHWIRLPLVLSLLLGVSLSAAARSALVAREAATAILETKAGQTLARELGIGVGSGARLSQAEKTEAFLKALSENPKLEAQLSKQSSQFIQMAQQGKDYQAISSQLGLTKIHTRNNMAQSLRVQGNDNSIRTAAKDRVSKDALVDRSLAQKAMQTVAAANQKLGGQSFLRDGYKTCLQKFSPKAVNNANSLAQSGAEGIIAASNSGVKSSMELLTAGARSLFHRYSEIFGVNKAEAKKSVCTLGNGQCRMWRTGTACL
ncbi:MAG: hypothetical protein KDD61_03055 [Bdellovibrionales bacterium]|nr:hypothetical protein [Bdellovibrionales bacterium]